MLRFALPLFVIAHGCTRAKEPVPIVVGQWCDSDRSAEIACVIDGDTVYADSCDADGEVIRLLGVSAPEIDHGDGGAECFGDEALDFLDWVLDGRSVNLQFDTECTDIYDRTLAWMVIDVDEDDDLVPLLFDLDELGLQQDGSFEVLVNELLIRAGYAEVYDTDLSEDVRYGRRIEEAEAEAESEERGLHAADACEDSD
mgnify:CR=1 FL=1